MLEYGVGNAQVAFGVLVVDGVDLVGHGARSHFAFLDFLLEVLHHYVHPKVAAQVDEYDVDALDGVEDGRQVVVVRNLRGERFAAQPEVLGHEAVAEVGPVNLWEGHVVGVEVARGASELGRHGQGFQGVELALQAADEHHYLLAQASGRGRLPVGLGQHRDVFPLVGIAAQAVYHLLHFGAVDVGKGLAQRQGHRRVVDVLRRQSEVNELLVCRQAQAVELLLQEVFDGLDVVVGHRFDVFDALRLGAVEVGVYLAQALEAAVVDALELGQRQLAERYEVFYLDPHAVADQCVFRKVVSKFVDLGAIAAVDGRDGRECLQIHVPVIDVS